MFPLVLYKILCKFERKYFVLVVKIKNKNTFYLDNQVKYHMGVFDTSRSQWDNSVIRYKNHWFLLDTLLIYFLI